MGTNSIAQVKRSIAASTLQANESKKILKPETKKCLYYPEMACEAPHCKMEMCSRCPYGYVYTAAYAVRSVFKKIIGIAILLTDKIYFSKTDSRQDRFLDK